MFEQIYKNINQHVTLTEEEWDLCQNSFKPKKMRKSQFLLQEGDISRSMAFIEKGGLYSYSVDENGTQHVMQFGFEGSWIGNMQSFFTDSPSTIDIKVLEDCELLLIGQNKHRKLLDNIPCYSHYMRVIVQQEIVAMQRRVENALGLTAEKKYKRLLANNPEFLNRAPQHLVASYLGISPETLSRVRGQMTQ
jgi:CRP-like cAMP-binding protein